MLVAASVALIGYFSFGRGDSTGVEVPEPAPVAGIPTPIAPAVSTSVAGIEGASVSALAIDPLRPRTVFAAAFEAGVFRSTDGGASWRALNIAAPGTRIDSVAVSAAEPGTVYVGTGRGIFKSTDDGATWRGSNAGLFGNESAFDRVNRLVEGYVYALVIDPRTRGTVYAGTWQRGLLKSTNGGQSWRRLGFMTVGDVVLDPQDPDTLYLAGVGAFGTGARSDSGVFKSADAGRTWKAIGLQGNNVDALTIDPQHPATLYAATATGLFKTTNGGESWQATGREGGILRLTVDPQHPETLYAGTDTGVLKSTNGGHIWHTLDAGREGRDGINALGVDPQNPAAVYVGTGAGVLRSTDAGDSWEASTAGMTGARVSALAVDGRHRRTAYAIVGSQGVFKRVGGDWRAANVGLPSLDASGLAVSPRGGTVYVALDSDVFRSSDRARTWRRVHAPSATETTDVSALAVDPRNPEIVYAGTVDSADRDGPRSGVFKSTDGGATWRVTPAEPPPKWQTTATPLTPGDTSLIVIDPHDSLTVYAAGDGFFRSMDGGATWSSSRVANYVNALALDPSRPTTLYLGTFAAGVLKSKDGGKTWRALNATLEDPLQDLSVQALAVDPQSHAVYAGADRGVFVSGDGGASWRRLGGVGSRSIRSLAIDQARRTLYVGTEGGGLVEAKLSR